MKRKSTSIVNLLLLVSALVFSLAIAEITARLAVPLPSDPLGWSRAQSEVKFAFEDTPGVLRNITVNYAREGFRRYPVEAGNMTRVLILGDSFTEMVYVQANESWYSFLERAFPGTAFYVHGVGGYGSTQEMLVLEKYVDQVNPDIIIWQMFFNDFINDYHPADLREYPLNSQGLRPYLVDGNIVYRYPAPLDSMRRNFALARGILPLYDLYRYNKEVNATTFFEVSYGTEFWQKPFTESAVWGGNFSAAFTATDASFARARRSVPDIPIYVFSVDDRLRDSEVLIAANHGFVYLDGFTAYMKEAESNESIRIVGDQHWNRRGNELAGNYLTSYFRNDSLLR